MKKLDRQWLANLGIRGLSPELADDLIRRVIDELEKRVGAKIATRLSRAELSEFGAIMEDPDERATSEWFSQHVPDRELIVLATFDEVEQELRDRRDQINALGEASVSSVGAVPNREASRLGLPLPIEKSTPGGPMKVDHVGHSDPSPLSHSGAIQTEE